MNRTFKSYGLDPALNHGVLLEAEWDLTVRAEPHLIGYEVLVSWLQDKGMRVADRDIYGLCNHMMSKCTPSRANCVGIDWDQNSIHWGNTTKLQAIKMAMFMGYAVAGFHSRRITPVYITPETIRNHFGKAPNAAKEVVLDYFFSRLGIGRPPEDLYQDVQDALVLSYLVLLAERDDTNYWASQ